MSDRAIFLIIAAILVGLIALAFLIPEDPNSEPAQVCVPAGAIVICP